MVEAKGNDTIGHVKQIAATMFREDYDELLLEETRLISGNKQLNEEKTVAEEELEDNCTILMVPKGNGEEESKGGRQT